MSAYIYYGRMVIKALLTNPKILEKNYTLETQWIIDYNHLNMLILSKYENDDISENDRKMILKAKIDYFKNSSSLQEVIFKLTQAGIDYRLIKGVLIANTYPFAYSRVFGDYDILVRKHDLDNAVKIINSCLYYEGEDFITLKDISLFKDNYKKIELHFDIIIKTSQMSNEIQELIWSTPYEYKIDNYMVMGPDPKTHLIYIVFHISKHFNSTGFGLRHLIDLKYLIEKHKINMNEVDDFFKKYGYEKFFRSLIMLCVDELSLNFDYRSLGWDRNDFLQESLFEYVIRVGTFGNTSKESILTNLYESKIDEKYGINKWGVFLKVLFPSKENLIKQYPYVAKSNFLIPVAWIKRLINQSFSTNYSLKEKMFAFTLDKSLLNSKVYLLKEFGLRKNEK